MRFYITFLPLQKKASANILAECFARIGGDRLLARLFYDGCVSDAKGFIEEILRPGSLPFVVWQGERLAALTWLNTIQGRSARTHFVILRDFWGQKFHESIGRNLYGHILTRKDDAGYMFDCLWGLTPENNTLAWKAALRCGWQVCGSLPQACYMASMGKSIDGIITCATRDILGIEDGADWSGIWEI